jgi:hypothetical protein
MAKPPSGVVGMLANQFAKSYLYRRWEKKKWRHKFKN